MGFKLKAESGLLKLARYLTVEGRLRYKILVIFVCRGSVDINYEKRLKIVDWLARGYGIT